METDVDQLIQKLDQFFLYRYPEMWRRNFSFYLRRILLYNVGVGIFLLGLFILILSLSDLYYTSDIRSTWLFLFTLFGHFVCLFFYQIIDLSSDPDIAPTSVRRNEIKSVFSNICKGKSVSPSRGDGIFSIREEKLVYSIICSFFALLFALSFISYSIIVVPTERSKAVLPLEKHVRNIVRGESYIRQQSDSVDLVGSPRDFRDSLFAQLPAHFSTDFKDAEQQDYFLFDDHNINPDTLLAAYYGSLKYLGLSERVELLKITKTLDSRISQEKSKANIANAWVRIILTYFFYLLTYSWYFRDVSQEIGKALGEFVENKSIKYALRITSVLLFFLLWALAEAIFELREIKAYNAFFLEFEKFLNYTYYETFPLVINLFSILLFMIFARGFFVFPERKLKYLNDQAQPINVK